MNNPPPFKQVQFLLHRGADPGAVDCELKGAVELAVEEGDSFDVVKVLWHHDKSALHGRG